MIDPQSRFYIFILVALLLFIAILHYVMRRRSQRPDAARVLMVSALVVVGGMVLAKHGHGAGWPWWIYYTVPAAATLLLPPLAFRLSAAETAQYLLLAFLSSPVIHVLFSFLLGWHEYMPFIRVPSLAELLA